MKNISSILFLIFLICFFIQCEEPDTIINEYKEYNEYSSRPMEFGETIYDLKPDTIYHAATDGFLYVDIKSFGPHQLEQINAKIYADSISNPSRQVGTVYYSNTLPIKKDYYWNVKKTTGNGKLNISWTPIK
jgi:hypothetical protein